VRIPIQDVLAKRVRSSGPRSVVSTWLTDGCSPSLGRLAGAGWCWRSVAGPTTSPSQGSPSARCRCTQPATPSGCGSRSAPRSRLRRRPATPSGGDPRISLSPPMWSWSGSGVRFTPLFARLQQSMRKASTPTARILPRRRQV